MPSRARRLTSGPISVAASSGSPIFTSRYAFTTASVIFGAIPFCRNRRRVVVQRWPATNPNSTASSLHPDDCPLESKTGPGLMHQLCARQFMRSRLLLRTVILSSSQNQHGRKTTGVVLTLAEGQP
jgi:hypothetical protein